MNLGQNKFFVGLGAVMLVGSAVLGWFLYQSYSDYSDADAKYQEQVTKLQQLQNLPLYPEASNLKVLEDQEKKAAEDAVTLHKQLVPMSFPLEQMTPQQFQDTLNASVKTLIDKAAKAGVKLEKDKFFLGFGEYKTVIPSPDAAAVLGRQLKCIELAVDTMIERKVASIADPVRTHLPEEEKAKPGAQPTPTPPQRPGKAAPVLLNKYPFEITFVAEERAFQSVLNDLSKTDRQFFIIQPVAIKNEQPQSPKKNALHPVATSPGANKTEKLQYVFGAEKLNVTLRFDSVVFASNLPK